MKLAQIPPPTEQSEAGTAVSVARALDGLRTAITVYDAAMCLRFANQHVNYLFRALPHRDSLVGRSFADLVRLEIAGGEIAPGELAAGHDAFIARRIAQFQESNFQPLDIGLADGRIIEIKARRAPDGGWIALWNDVTAARHALMRLEDTIALSADAFAFWDRNDRLTLASRKFAELHGHSEASELAGIHFRDMVASAVAHGHFRMEEGEAAWFDRRLEAHKAPAGAHTVTTRKGEAFLVRERPTRDGGSVSVFTDVTDRHRVENALEEQSQALARTREQASQQANYLSDLLRKLEAAQSEAGKAKTALLRTMSHELKTPLNAILGFADLLRAAPDRFGPDKIAEYATLIHTAGGNLLRLINLILDLTKIAAKRYPLTRQALSPNTAFHAVCDLYGARAEEKNVTIHIERSAKDCLAYADEPALTAMIGHLVENALNALQPGGEIRLSATREGQKIRLDVSDNGPGVLPDDLKRIAEPFEQIGGGSLDRINGGAGLGLPLVKGLAEIQNGSLMLSSTVGIGFSGIITLPAA